MTTTGNGDRARVVEHVDGIVEGVNERGVHLLGEQDWRNFSKYGDRLPPPGGGTRVRLGLDSGGFVRTLQVLDQPDAASRSRDIRRLAVLKAAANFLGLMSQCREEIKSEHVLVLADRWLAWVEQESSQ
jgi:hypothetical protein